jgi:hypothetical protein
MSAACSAVPNDLHPDLVRRWEKLRRDEMRRETRHRLWAKYGHPLRGWRLPLMILGFIAWWPIGLALLGFFAWRTSMFCNSNRMGRVAPWSAPWTAWKERARETIRDAAGPGFAPSGNIAFDEHRERVLRRLEEERRQLDAQAAEFAAFVQTLRRAKDQEEFDRFMQGRAQGQN